MVSHFVRKLSNTIFFKRCKKTLTLSVYLLYMWTCVIALYQIISVINTQNYKALYGDDPLAERPSNEKPASKVGKNMEIENVQFYSKSDFSHYSPIKMRDDKFNNRLVTTISIT